MKQIPESDPSFAESERLEVRPPNLYFYTHSTPRSNFDVGRLRAKVWEVLLTREIMTCLGDRFGE